MATSSTILPSSLIPRTNPSIFSHNQQVLFLQNRYLNSSAAHKTKISFCVLAAKIPAGVEFPKVQPQFQAPFLGFTKTAEVWNSRACMIGIIGVFIVEFIINRGILQVIGVDVGKGLDLPL
ncbi:light-harvesting complex-like protein OHP1, chloroplastic [Gastrolobium bilobum]|uniref:light-harvesting complex-like protein OHP1, chloroplastic n=1 Tax=Gastrolobium bilobum TaxID=150636 RepID=UPI002AB12A68|nr:light-harvesting complex-like protein OHP1, chloroplastic [Gastrolobium bilobum]